MARKIRIGIDVGGTFTDAIALDNDTYEIIGMKKVHTTHEAKEGVTKGVIDILNLLLKEIKCNADDVVFIAHGTTQATNALLEGDVADIGVIGMGSGIGVAKIKADTDVGNVSLEDDKAIKTSYRFLNTANGIQPDEVEKILNEFEAEGRHVIVVSEAFSVDDPSHEREVADIAVKNNMIVTATHELSKLYGLRARTKTAVINASILPKMMQTASMTEQAVKDAKVKAPLMIMRSDGGVMQVEEVKKRPILTVLSGPAAGVAGALMYEKISDGIFLEVGGTSTDISAIQNGKVITKYSKIGGHNTYVSSLDIHTIGIGGGSMVRFRNQTIIDVGPRSSHIAGLAYACFAGPEELKGSKVISVTTPKDKTTDFLALETPSGKRYAITLTCAANRLGCMPEGDYARGNEESVKIAFDILAETFGKKPEKIARDIVNTAVSKVVPAVEEFIKEYNLSQNYLILTGGGGGASAVVPAVAEKMRLNYKIAENAPVIATIGAALAMVRDSIERTIINPSQEDILKIRNEAEQAVIKAGASPSTVEVTIDIDTAKNIVKAVAVGTTDLSAKASMGEALTEDELEKTVRDSFNQLENCRVEKVFGSPTLHAYHIGAQKKSVIPFFKKKVDLLCVIDCSGVIKLSVEQADFYEFSGRSKSLLEKQIEEHMKFDESGKTSPMIYLLINGKIADLSGLDSLEQISSLADIELQRLGEDDHYLAVIKKR
ncbi:MAG: hydantoinase/oxoprolinase family protein [Clostridiaceae bacterium]|nr:hydantoinase/oxoprolinase family protein [Clostridiaceae bacterium]